MCLVEVAPATGEVGPVDPSNVRIELVRRLAGRWHGADTSDGSGQSTGGFVLRGQRLALGRDAGAYQCGKDPQPDFPDTAVHRLA